MAVYTMCKKTFVLVDDGLPKKPKARKGWADKYSPYPQLWNKKSAITNKVHKKTFREGQNQIYNNM